MQVTDQQLDGLRTICDAIIPSIEKEHDPDGFWKRKASDLKVAEKIIDLAAVLPIEDQKELKQLCDLMNSPLLGLTWRGAFKKVQDLSEEQREQLLQKWMNSRIPNLRKAFGTLKKLTTIIYLGISSTEMDNPNWKSVGYPGPNKEKPPVQEEYLQPLLIKDRQSLSCDVVIVGSGAGGGVVAGELAQAGKKVIIVEKGPYLKNTELNQRELPMIETLYERKGLLVSNDGAMTIFAGSCVGGGTTVNWAGSFRTPDYVLEEWATAHGNPHFTDKAYLKCFEAIEQRLHVNTTDTFHNPQNQALWDGSEKLGYKVKLIPRNTKNCDHDGQPNGFCKKCGYGTLGDAYGHKQCMPTTYLLDAQKAGAQIVANAEVEKVIIESGHATGVIAWHTDEQGKKHKIRINADKVVVAASAIHTPAVLKRSGLINPYIGRHLHLHPVMAVTGYYDHPIEPWYGPMMSAVCDEFNRLTGNHGFKLETAPVHCGVGALAMPWNSGRQFKEEVLKLKNTATFIVLCRDKHGGRITLSKEKQPRPHYKLHNYDKKHLLKGVEEAIRIHAAAGAKEIKLIHNCNATYHRETGNLEAFIKGIYQQKWTANNYGLFSAHQMGSCRMGGDSKRYPVNPKGESYEVNDLYVADGSLFPAASGANPMLSIQALAYYVAQGLK